MTQLEAPPFFHTLRHVTPVSRRMSHRARRVLRRWPPGFLGVSPKRSLGEGLGETPSGCGISEPEDFLGGFGGQKARPEKRFGVYQAPRG